MQRGLWNLAGEGLSKPIWDAPAFSYDLPNESLFTSQSPLYKEGPRSSRGIWPGFPFTPSLSTLMGFSSILATSRVHSSATPEGGNPGSRSLSGVTPVLRHLVHCQIQSTDLCHGPSEGDSSAGTSNRRRTVMFISVK